MAEFYDDLNRASMGSDWSAPGWSYSLPTLFSNRLVNSGDNQEHVAVRVANGQPTTSSHFIKATQGNISLYTGRGVYRAVRVNTSTCDGWYAWLSGDGSGGRERTLFEVTGNGATWTSRQVITDISDGDVYRVWATSTTVQHRNDTTGVGGSYSSTSMASNIGVAVGEWSSSTFDASDIDDVYGGDGTDYSGGSSTATGSAAVTLADATPSASGTFTPSPVTGSGTPSLADATSAGSGTHTPPTFTGSGTPTLEDATSAGSGTFTLPTRTGSGTPSLADATGAGTGMFVNPTLTGSGTPTLADATSAGAGTHTAPSFTGSGTPALDDAIGAGSGTFTLPTRTGSGAPTLDDATGSGTGTFVTTSVTGSGTPTLEDAVSAGTGTVVNPSFTGSAAVSLQDATGAASGTFTTPVFAGAGETATQDATSAGAGVYVSNPSGTAAVELEDASSDGTATIVNPTPPITGYGAVVLDDFTGGPDNPKALTKMAVRTLPRISRRYEVSRLRRLTRGV